MPLNSTTQRLASKLVSPASLSGSAKSPFLHSVHNQRLVREMALPTISKTCAPSHPSRPSHYQRLVRELALPTSSKTCASPLPLSVKTITPTHHRRPAAINVNASQPSSRDPQRRIMRMTAVLEKYPRRSISEKPAAKVSATSAPVKTSAATSKTATAPARFLHAVHAPVKTSAPVSKKVIPPIPAGPYSRPASEAPQYARPSSQQSTYSYTNPAQNPAGGSSQNHQRSTSLNNPPTNAGSTPGPRSRLVPQTSRTSLNSTGSHNHWEQDKYLDPAYLAAGATGGEDSVAGKGKQREDGAGWPQYFHRE